MSGFSAINSFFSFNPQASYEARLGELNMIHPFREGFNPQASYEARHFSSENPGLFSFCFNPQASYEARQ